MSAKEAFDRVAVVLGFMQVAQALRDVRGLRPIEGLALMQLARLGEGTGQVVEIGSFMGRSTCWLALGAKEAGRGPVFAVDHFRGSPEHQAGARFEVPELAAGGSTLPIFENNLRRLGVRDVVRPIVSGSVEAARAWEAGPIRLLFIDGDHSYEASQADFQAWSGYVSERGCVAFHDIGTWEGVTRFYKELVASDTRYQEVGAVLSLRVVQRVR